MYSSFLVPRSSFLLLSLFTLSSLLSCSSDDSEPYPSLLTELVMAQADGEGVMVSFTTDDGTTYTVDNHVGGMDGGSRLRCLCGYAIEEEQRAIVYTAQAVPVLADASEARNPKRHPTGIASAWLSGGFVNLHLTPKTHGGRQVWGYVRDSVTQNALGGATFHLSLYHDQADDAAAYTTDLYACIALDSLSTALTSSDSIRLTVETFDGDALWMFEVRDSKAKR